MAMICCQKTTFPLNCLANQKAVIFGLLSESLKLNKYKINAR